MLPWGGEGGGGRGAVLIVIGRGCVQGYQSLTDKYNQRKTTPQNIIFDFGSTKNIIFVFHCYNIDLPKYNEMDLWKRIISNKVQM